MSGESLRAHARETLSGPDLRAMIAAVHADPEPEPDVRPLYRELARRGLLVPNWPAEYGGAGGDLLDAGILHEELVRAGVPDTLYVNTILIVGLFILMVGTPQQRAEHLPPIAAGQRFASVLYTEPHCGSDLSALSTVAVRDHDGDWKLTGTKVFSLKSHLTDVALCAARTGGPDSKLDGISLFLVDLHAPGIRRTPIRSISNEQFHRVELDGVRVPARGLLGDENGGWPLITHSLRVERTGMDYSLKAEAWLAEACRRAGSDPGDAMLEEIGRHGAAVDASRLLAWKTLADLADGRVDEPGAAVSKYYSSELAQRIAAWSALRLPDAGPVLEAAFREAPGVTMAGGTSDMMLRIISSLALDEVAFEETSG
jgi:alkylation response protein AidB-like acyl-CoA dehydrogenase